jgi:gas vesicle protein
MDTDIQKLKDSLQKMPEDVQELVKNMVQLISIQNNQIEFLKNQLQGFMDIQGPEFSDIASAFSKAAQNTFTKSDAVQSVSDLNEAVRDNTKWIDAALKSFQFAKGVVSFLK